MAVTSQELETQSIKSLLIKQSIPASIGVLFMSLNIMIDTIFVGRWIGSIAIAAVTVVLPITFLISSLGMAIGIGGSSVLSRALGAKDREKALITFGNQIILTGGLSIICVVIGLLFSDEVLFLFGAQGSIVESAQIYFFPIILTVPFLAFCMMGNNVIRAEGKAKFAMYSMIIPAFANVILNVLFIKILGWGILGSATATGIAYIMSFLFILWFFIYKSELKMERRHLKLDRGIVQEITKLSLVTFSRQGIISVLAIIVNHTLYKFAGEHSIASYGIISRMLMFALFPILGLTQGFLPIAGYNYGAKNWDRVKETLVKSIKYASVLSTIILIIILLFSEYIIRAFTSDAEVVRETPSALCWVFAASPIIAIQLIGSSYFQAAGKARMAMFLSLSKQGIFLIPLLLILPHFFNAFGVWISFPIADVLATAVTFYFLRKEVKNKLTVMADGIL